MATTLIFGPSRAGKTYLTKAFVGMGLPAVDGEFVDGLIGWFGPDGKRAEHLRPTMPPSEWFATYKFLTDKKVLKKYLGDHPDVILLLHTRNIMECLDMFDHVFYLYVPPAELERRFLIERPDHKPSTPEQIAFMRERHQERYAQVMELGIPVLDATQTPAQIYQNIYSTISVS